MALASEPSLDLAAKAAGCGPRTLKRWKAEDAAFRAELECARGCAAFEDALAALSALAGQAVGTLRSVLRDPQAQLAAS